MLEKVMDMEEEQALHIINKSTEKKEIIDLCRVLIHKEKGWSNVTSILRKLQQEEPEKIRHSVMGYMYSVLLSGKRNDRAAIVLEYFSEPFYDSGKNGLILACYQSFFTNL